VRPEIAVPLLMRDELLGIAFYGQRDDAATLDPEERRFLRRLGDAAAIAYEAVDAKEAKRALAAANARLAALGMAVLEGDPARG
jgi:GAF domain-containing protein